MTSIGIILPFWAVANFTLWQCFLDREKNFIVSFNIFCTFFKFMGDHNYF